MLRSVPDTHIGYLFIGWHRFPGVVTFRRPVRSVHRAADTRCRLGDTHHTSLIAAFQPARMISCRAADLRNRHLPNSQREVDHLLPPGGDPGDTHEGESCVHLRETYFWPPRPPRP